MKTYPDAMILDWMQFIGGTVNHYHLRGIWNSKAVKGWEGRNSGWYPGTLRAAVTADITSARKDDRRCVAAFRRTTRGSLWAEYLTPR